MDGPEPFGQALHQAGELLRELTTVQRVWLAVGALVVGVTLYLFAGIIVSKSPARYSGLTTPAGDSIPPQLHSAVSLKSPTYASDEELTTALIHTLESVVGTDHLRATVHIEYENSTTENAEELYSPKNSAILSQQKSTENPGESSTFAVRKTSHHTVQPAGRIKRITAAVVVDDVVQIIEQDGRKTTTRRKYTAEELKQLEQLAGAAIGLEISRGDSLTLRNLLFQQPAAETPTFAIMLEQSRQTMMRWSGILRYVEIAVLFSIVYFLVLRPIKKQVLVTLQGISARASTKTGEMAAPVVSSELELPGSEQSKRTAVLKKQVADKMAGGPAIASRVVQSWIREGDTK